MDVSAISFGSIGILVAFFFFKDLYKKFTELQDKVKEMDKEDGRLRGKIDRLNEVLPTKLQNIEKIFYMEVKQLGEQIQSVKDDIKLLSQTMSHTDKTLMTNAQLFKKIIEELKQDKSQ